MTLTLQSNDIADGHDNDGPDTNTAYGDNNTVDGFDDDDDNSTIKYDFDNNLFYFNTWADKSLKVVLSLTLFKNQPSSQTFIHKGRPFSNR